MSGNEEFVFLRVIGLIITLCLGLILGMALEGSRGEFGREGLWLVFTLRIRG